MLGEIFYRNCLSCGFKSEDGKIICIDCIEELETYPHSCESCGFPSNVPVKICGRCRLAKHRDRIIILYKYKGAVKKLIREIKFSYRVSGLDILSEILPVDIFDNYDIITDVPSHFTRNIRRMTHPARVIAKKAAENSGVPYRRVLKRVRRTEYQYKLKRAQRVKNVNGAFTCQEDVTGLKILLVDDIITTGSTIEECSRILKRSGALLVDVLSLTGGS